MIQEQWRIEKKQWPGESVTKWFLGDLPAEEFLYCVGSVRLPAIETVAAHRAVGNHVTPPYDPALPVQLMNTSSAELSY